MFLATALHDAAVLQERVDELPVIDQYQVLGRAQGVHYRAHHGDDLGVHGDRGGSGGVDIHLRELPEAPRARLVGAPDRPHRVAAEGRLDLVGVLREQAAQTAP